MCLLIRESNAILDEYIESGCDELYDILAEGAELETNCAELARELSDIFPNSVIRYKPEGLKRQRKKLKKRRK